jgi:hypothetical protein
VFREEGCDGVEPREGIVGRGSGLTSVHPEARIKVIPMLKDLIAFRHRAFSTPSLPS